MGVNLKMFQSVRDFLEFRILVLDRPENLEKQVEHNLRILDVSQDQVGLLTGLNYLENVCDSELVLTPGLI